ncbi:quinone oxidoreductase family protein [Sphingosinicella microcystinivorans]|uniref:quinone oxidoreductase family protein n=1 Tax=Sphingosinicella microcystinivorans TaxID=335406 RepID=UPI0022F3F219|nr:zinc-binding dehydrogenase [Sphingosinicella microcystinivorans]WBX85600.1 zinc-binding dehydrogenase [Sphingosinicella microcystinivorans]
MKAVVVTAYGTTEVLEYQDVPKPSPKAGELLIRVKASAVGFGDTKVRSGAYDDKEGFHGPKPPVILGFQASGIVEGAGAGVDQAWIGRNVVCNAINTNAEYIVCPVGDVARMPDGVPFDVATLIPNFYLTAYHVLETAIDHKPGQVVIMYAPAGGVGTALVQLGKLAGLRIIAVTSSPEKCRFALEQGAEHAIDMNRENVVEQVGKLTGGKGVDIIFNSILGESVLDDIDMLAPYGKLLIYGEAQGLPQGDIFRKWYNHGLQHSTSIVSFSLFTVMNWQPELIPQSMEALLQLVAEKKIAPQIYAKFPLTDVAKAHDLFESRAVMGNVVIEP